MGNAPRRPPTSLPALPNGTPITLQPKKCHLACQRVTYVGHLVTAGGGVDPDPSKVECVANFPVPHSIKDVRSFLGLTSYYRRFIKDYARISYPLRQILQDNQKFTWTEDMQHSFDELRQRLTTAPVLTCPDFNQPFVLQTDASIKGLGAVLSQKTALGEQVIAYLSRSLSHHLGMRTITSISIWKQVYCSNRS